jgi:hypothetical protein
MLNTNGFSDETIAQALASFGASASSSWPELNILLWKIFGYVTTGEISSFFAESSANALDGSMH